MAGEYNLLTERWIPVERKSGRREYMAPHEVASGYDDPIVRISMAQPDLEVGVFVFLVGLLQTHMAPNQPWGDEDGWQELLMQPPTGERLKNAWHAEEPYFDLFGDKVRCLQDPSLLRTQKSVEEPSAGQLMTATPTKTTVEHGADHFVKRGAYSRLCPSCAAAALIFLQANTPTGGRGGRISLRGRGPLNSLLVGDTLWVSLWLNVLSIQEWQAENFPGDDSADQPIDVYGWLRAISADKNAVRHSAELSPFHVYWATPRRVRLEDPDKHGKCDLCGEQTSLVSTFLAKGYGHNYTSDDWRHPLTPYYDNMDKKTKVQTTLPIRASALGSNVGYRDWLGLRVPDAGRGRYPAVPVRLSLEQERFSAARDAKARLWVCGWAMQGAKPLVWQDAVLPGMPGGENVFGGVADAAGGQIGNGYKAMIESAVRMVRLVEEIVCHLANAFKQSKGGQGKDLSAQALDLLCQRVWDETERAFYNLMGHAWGGGCVDYNEWAKRVADLSMVVFDQWCAAQPFDAVNASRMGKARKDFMLNVDPKYSKSKKYSKKLLALLGTTPVTQSIP